MNNSKKVGVWVACVVVLFIGIFIVINAVSGNSDTNTTKTDSSVTQENYIQVLQEAADRVKNTENAATKGTVSYEDTAAEVELPDIDKSYPKLINPNADTVVEIFVSPEKAGNGNDGWMLELAKKFNNTKPTASDGSSIAIEIRSMSSGPQYDYVNTGVYVPQAISPSASMWGEMLENDGVELTTILDKTVGNTAGILINKANYDTVAAEYGEVTVATIVKATTDGKMTMGYTNPFSSTTGLNFIASALYSFDNANPLSTASVEKFNAFQANVPFVAFNTSQMKKAAENGTFTCFINEYQAYMNDASMQNNYQFIPFGIRHDNPLYAIGTLTNNQQEALQQFADYITTSEAINLATEYGFNKMDDYKSNENVNGNAWVQMQKLWKQNKNTAKPIAAVFVLDTSGSMSGEPMNQLKTSLTNSMKYINSTNYIGVVSYASNVNVDLPIGVFDINQQAYFMGAVTGLQASGGTATYSALAKSAVMLNDFMQTNPNVQPMIFLLSDGEQNEGASLNSITDALKISNIPVYTIGYNANLAELKTVSDINEAASIDADSDDVVYQLKNLFNANL